MITLYYADISGKEAEGLLADYKNKIDSQRYDKVMRIQAPEARVRSLIAGFLLQRAVKEALGSGEVLPLSVAYGPQRKPYLEEYPDIFFNMSHSGKVVVCAICNEEIGVDVQEYRKIKEGVAERFFTVQEQKQLKDLQADAEEYEKLFFRMWSVKESYIKYTGLGMKQGLDTFSIDWEKGQIRDVESGKVTACFQEVSIKVLPRYAVSVCTSSRKEIVLREVSLNGSGRS